MKKFLSLTVLLLLACVSPESKAKRVLDSGLTDASPIIRVSAAKSLMDLGDTRGNEVLKAMAVDGEPDLQVTALNALYEAGQTELDPVIISLCNSPSTQVREAAYRIAASSDAQEARAILLQGVDDEYARVREAAYSGLVRFQQMDALLQGLRDPEPQVRIAVARTLGKLGAEGMSEFIRDELKRFQPGLWGRGIKALAELGDTTAVPLLKRLLQEGTEELRVDAAEALLILNDESGVPILLQSLRSKDPFVRIHTVEVLKRHDVPASYDVLKVATVDEYINVAVNAVEALAKHDSENQRKHFIELMDSSNILLRISAAAAYLRI